MRLNRSLFASAFILAFAAPSFAGDVYWNSDSDGFWNEPIHWIPGAPKDGDRVFIQRPNADITTTFRSDALTLLQLISDERFVLATGRLTLSTLGPMSKFNSDFVITGGILFGNDIEVFGTTTLAGGALVGPSRVIARGPTVFTGEMPVQFAGGRQLFTYGPVTVSGNPTVVVNDGVSWEVAPNTIVHFTGDSRFWATQPSPGPLVNAGTLRKSGYHFQSVTIQMPIRSSGPIEVLGGSLNLGWPSADSLISGPIFIAEGATFGWHGGKVALHQVQGPGTLLLRCGDVLIPSSLSWTGPLVVDGANVTFGPGSSFQRSDVTISGGSLFVSEPARITGRARFHGGALVGPSTVELEGLTTVSRWTYPLSDFGLRNNVRLINRNELSLEGDIFIEMADSVLENANGATLRMESNTAIAMAGSVLVNANGATLQMLSKSGIAVVGQNSSVLNRGLLTKTGLSSSINAAFNNSGQLLVSSGLLRFTGDFLSEGTIRIESPGELEWRGNTTILGSVVCDGNLRILLPLGLVRVTFLPGSSLNVTGKTVFSGPTLLQGEVQSLGREVQINSEVTFPLVTLNVPLLSITNTATGPVTFVVTNSSVSGSAALQGGAKIVVTGTGNSWQLPAMAPNSSAENRGTIVFRSGINTTVARPFAGLLLNTAQGVMTLDPNGGSFGRPSDTGLYRNEGLLVAPESHQGTTIDVRLLNLGVVDVRAGTLALRRNSENYADNTLTGGTWRIGQQLRMGDADIRTNKANIELNGPSAGFLQFTGTTSALANFNLNAAEGRFAVTNGATFTTGGAFTNNGEIAIGPESEFSVAGKLVSGADSALALTLGGRPNGKLKVTGEWAIDGKLKVTWGNGFTPVAGSTFELAQFGSATGEELELDAPGLPGGLGYRWARGLTSLSLVITMLGDTDGSGCVDDADLTNLLLDFGGAGGTNGETDINRDGVVDDADLTELILAFGTGC